jgi:hypothetical protein
MFVMIAALGLIGKIAGDPTHPQGGPRAVIGTGAQPCAIALSPARQLEAQTWALGYWSGVNAAGPKNVQVADGVQGMLSSLATYCKAHTGVPLQDAVQQVLSGKQ